MRATLFMKATRRAAWVHLGRPRSGVSRPSKRRRFLLRLRLGLCLAALPLSCMADIHWGEAWDVRANGRKLSVEPFTSSWQPDQVAQELARRHGAYQRYLVGAGRILLSGVQPGEHWLAEIQGRSYGAQGYVSALYFDAARHDPVLPANSHGASAAARPRMAAAGLGLPLQVFEFDDSTWVSLVQPPAGGLPDSGTPPLLATDAQTGVALAISLPEH